MSSHNNKWTPENNSWQEEAEENGHCRIWNRGWYIEEFTLNGCQRYGEKGSWRSVYYLDHEKISEDNEEGYCYIWSRIEI